MTYRIEVDGTEYETITGTQSQAEQRYNVVSDMKANKLKTVELLDPQGKSMLFSPPWTKQPKGRG